MNDLQSWAPTILWAVTIICGGSIYLMDIGGFRQRAKDAATSSAEAHQKIDAINKDLNNYKILAARDFASITAVAESERRFAAAVEGIRTDFRAVADRFDKLLFAMARDSKDT